MNVHLIPVHVQLRVISVAAVFHLTAATVPTSCTSAPASKLFLSPNRTASRPWSVWKHHLDQRARFRTVSAKTAVNIVDRPLQAVVICRPIRCTNVQQGCCQMRHRDVILASVLRMSSLALLHSGHSPPTRALISAHAKKPESWYGGTERRWCKRKLPLLHSHTFSMTTR